MAFIRIKGIGKRDGKKYSYAYLVENRWRKRLKGNKKGSRQKVSRYLGKVLKIEKEREFGFFEFINIKDNPNYLESNKEKIVEDLVRYELFVRGFIEIEQIMEKNRLRFDLRKNRFIDAEGNEENIVIEMNEGFLCSYTLSRLINFKSDNDDEREKGIALAKTFLEAGLAIPKEIFIGYYEKV
jgi:hypothetical protein